MLKQQPGRIHRKNIPVPQYRAQMLHAGAVEADFKKKLAAAGFEVIGDEVFTPEDKDPAEAERIWNEVTGGVPGEGEV